MRTLIPYAGAERTRSRPHGVGTPAGQAHKPEELVAMYMSGMTVTQIASELGCTKQNVQQKLKRANVTAEQGGATVRGRQRAAAREQNRIAKVAARERRRGLPTGVYLRDYDERYVARVAGKQLAGSYATPEEARAAREAMMVQLGKKVKPCS